MVIDLFSNLKFNPYPKPLFVASIYPKNLPSQSSNSSDFLSMYSIDFDTKLFRGIEFVVRLKLPSFLSSSSLTIPNSCNGLLCIRVEQRSHQVGYCCILNPMTNEYIQLPKYGEKDSRVYNYGLGFSLKTKQYKIIVITIESYIEPTVTAVDIFTLGCDNEWRSINFIPFNFFPSNIECGVYLNGALYWVGRDRYTDTLWRFDIEDEKFEEITLPRIKSINNYPVHIQVFNGYLYVNLCDQMKQPCEIEMWMMQTHKRKESWERVFVIKNTPKDHRGMETMLLHIIKVYENGDLLFFARNTRSSINLFLYDSKNERMKEIIKIKVPFVSVLQIQSPNFDSLKNMVAGDCLKKMI